MDAAIAAAKADASANEPLSVTQAEQTREEKRQEQQKQDSLRRLRYLKSNRDFKLKYAEAIEYAQSDDLRNYKYYVETYGIDVYHVADGESLIHFLIQQDRPPIKILQYLLEEKFIESDTKFKAGNCNALQYAAHKGYTSIVELLLNNGANVNLTFDDKATALLYAVSSPEEVIDIIRLLLEAGADIKKSTKAGLSLIEISKSYAEKNPLRKDYYEKIIHILRVFEDFLG